MDQPYTEDDFFLAGPLWFVAAGEARPGINGGHPDVLLGQQNEGGADLRIVLAFTDEDLAKRFIARMAGNPMKLQLYSPDDQRATELLLMLQSRGIGHVGLDMEQRHGRLPPISAVINLLQKRSQPG